MNRPIKFRAWHKMLEYMITHIDALNYLNNELSGIYYEDREESNNRISINNIVLMQYTGLNDKNGKEIFEGDIVKRIKKTYNYTPESYDDNFYKNEEQISFIEYRGNGFWVNHEDFGYEGENLWDWAEMEVIGNIHQNPELIKTEKHAD